jgi:DNA-binding response OmpR family regulator
MQILVVEDDPQLGQGLLWALRAEGLEPTWAATRAQADLELRTGSFALVVLDRGLPDGDGLDLLRQLRRKDDRTPVLVLTARESVEDRVEGLDEGADDYLAKPFAMPELFSRIRALIRRSAGFASGSWTVGEVTVRHEAREVLVRGEPVELAPREYQVLHLLMRHAGRVLTRAWIEDQLSADQSGYESNALEVHIHHLRRKLGSDLIRTVRGVGYMVKP